MSSEITLSTAALHNATEKPRKDTCISMDSLGRPTILHDGGGGVAFAKIFRRCPSLTFLLVKRPTLVQSRWSKLFRVGVAWIIQRPLC